jgi:hypothetical protein
MSIASRSHAETRRGAVRIHLLRARRALTAQLTGGPDNVR